MRPSLLHWMALVCAVACGGVACGGSASTVNAAGNFFPEDEAAIVVYPYRAKVRFEGRERATSTAQTDGDCNGCHTQSGAQGAPGRIVLP